MSNNWTSSPRAWRSCRHCQWQRLLPGSDGWYTLWINLTKQASKPGSDGETSRQRRRCDPAQCLQICVGGENKPCWQMEKWWQSTKSGQNLRENLPSNPTIWRIYIPSNPKPFAQFQLWTASPSCHQSLHKTMYTCVTKQIDTRSWHFGKPKFSLYL